MPTVTATSSDMFLVEPYVSKYYGTGVCQPIDEPLGTVTTKDRFDLVEPYLIPVGENQYLGIRFRMLQPHELAAAQGFARRPRCRIPSKSVNPPSPHHSLAIFGVANIGSKSCWRKHIESIQILRPFLAPQLPYPFASG